MRARATRTKLSTTVAAENFRYLESLIQSGRAGSLAEAVDLAIHRSRRAENRERLAAATASYFENLSKDALEEEKTLGNALSRAAAGIDIDRG